MKILTVTREWSSDRRYGLGKSIDALTQGFKAHNIPHRYLCQEDLGHKAAKYLPKLNALMTKILRPLSKSSDLSTLAGLIVERLNMGRLAAKVAAAEQHTHVHCHDPIIAAGFRYFARLTPKCKAKWGVTEHGFGCYTQAIIDEKILLSPRVSRWMKRWESRTLIAADWVITPTHSGLKQLCRDLSINIAPPHWQTIVHPKPVLNHYCKEDARSQLNWAPQETVLLSIGRIVPLKRFDLLIQCLAKIPHAKLVILGSGDNQALIDLAQSLNCLDRLSIEMTDDIALYLHACDIYISTSQTESFGMANLEALITSTPSICTAVGGVPEVLDNAAQLIPSDSLPALCQQLNSLLDSPGQQALLSARAQNRIAQWPSTIELSQQHIALYETGTVKPLIQTLNTTQVELLNRQAPIHSWNDSLSPCPLPQVLAIDSSQKNLKVLVFAPHPDDETLGCGGTLAKLVKNGAHVRIVLMSLGEQGYPQGFDPKQAGETRKTEFLAATTALGIKDVTFYNQPDANLRNTHALSELILAEFNEFQPNWVYVPSPLDGHRDHVAAALSVLSIWEQIGCPSRMWLYEVWTTLPISHVVDITRFYTLKRAAILHYSLPLQCQDYLHYITGLNNYRGLATGNRSAVAEGFTELTLDNWQSLIVRLLDLRDKQEYSRH